MNMPHAPTRVSLVVDVPPPVAALLESLPAPGAALSLDDRRRFVAALEAVLTWLYPETVPPIALELERLDTMRRAREGGR